MNKKSSDFPEYTDSLTDEMIRGIDFTEMEKRVLTHGQCLIKNGLMGTKLTHVIIDEWSYTPLFISTSPREPTKEPAWKQQIPDPQAEKPVSCPSNAKRAKLRAKRKKKGKKS